MKQVKEPEIKLFGRKILLPDNGGDVATEEFSAETKKGSGGGGAADYDGCSEVSGGGEKADDEKLLLQAEEVLHELYEF